MHTGNRCSKTTRAKVSEVKKISVVLILQVHDGILYYITTLVHEFFPMKRSDESSSPNFLFFKVKNKRMLSRFATRRVCGTTLKTWGVRRYSQVWTVEERSINFGYCSAQRISGVHTNEPSVTNGSDNSEDLSLRDVCLGKPRVCAKDLSPQAMLIPDDEAAVDKEWKDVIKRHTTTTTRKVHFVALMDIRQFKSTCTSWWMFERAISSEETILCSMNLYMSKDFLPLRSLARTKNWQPSSRARFFEKWAELWKRR